MKENRLIEPRHPALWAACTGHAVSVSPHANGVAEAYLKLSEEYRFDNENDPESRNPRGR